MKKCSVYSRLDYQSTHGCLQLNAPLFACSTQKKSPNLFAMERCNKVCVCVRLVEWLHWLHTFLCNLLEKRYVTFMISWHRNLGDNFLADTLRYLSWPPLSRSWHLTAYGTGQGVMNHQTGCWPHSITVTQHPHLFSWARRQYGDHHELRVLRFSAPILFYPIDE